MACVVVLDVSVSTCLRGISRQGFATNWKQTQGLKLGYQQRYFLTCRFTWSHCFPKVHRIEVISAINSHKVSSRGHVFRKCHTANRDDNETSGFLGERTLSKLGVRRPSGCDEHPQCTRIRCRRGGQQNEEKPADDSVCSSGKQRQGPERPDKNSSDLIPRKFAKATSRERQPPAKKNLKPDPWQSMSLGQVLLLQICIAFVASLCSPFGFSKAHQSPSRQDAIVPVQSQSVPYSEFLHDVQSDNVRAVEVSGEKLTYLQRFARPQGTSPEEESPPPRVVVYCTRRPSDISTPYDQLARNNVTFGAAAEKPTKKLINLVLEGLLLSGFIATTVWRFRLHLPQQFTGRVWKRSGREKDKTTTVMFDDVAGVDEAKEELEEIVEFLRDPERLTMLGARPPRGVLLVGPPGTGKTLLARAVAGEADVPFISCAASEFVELYVGTGAARVRELFARAKRDAPSIVFIDEIDAVAKGRDGRTRTGGNDEREQTLNQLLTELDGFETNSTVIVLAATNRPDVLDPAFRRAGRFDRIVTVDAPDKLGRLAILNVHVKTKEIPLAPGVDLGAIAAATTGFTGADLANLVNEAALMAGRQQKSLVAQVDFMRAVERSLAGIEKKRSALGASEKGVVAHHEVGHAILGTAVARILPSNPPVQKLSIIPRSSGALGFTYIPPGPEERMLLFVDELRGRLVTLLGGRAAEEVTSEGRISTGALDDIRRATDVAYKAVAEYGLSENIGPISLATLSAGGLDDSGSMGGFSFGKDQGKITELVQGEVRTMLQTALEVARVVLLANQPVLEGLGSLLAVNESVEGEELNRWLGRVSAPAELTNYLHGPGTSSLPPLVQGKGLL